MGGVRFSKVIWRVHNDQEIDSESSMPEDVHRASSVMVLSDGSACSIVPVVFRGVHDTKLMNVGVGTANFEFSLRVEI